MQPGALARKVQAPTRRCPPGRTARQVANWFAHYRRRVIQPAWTRDKLVQRLDVIADLEDLAMKMGVRFDRFFADENGQPTGS